MRKRAIVAAVVTVAVLAVCTAVFVRQLLEPLDLPPVATNWGDRAVARGVRAPDQVGLRRAVLVHMAGRPAPPGLGKVQRICFDLPEAYLGGVPSGNWVPDAADLKWLTDRGLPFAPGYESCQLGRFPSLFVSLGRPARWWSQPEEVEVDDLVLYFPREKSVPIIECHVVVMVRGTAGWGVVRDEIRPVPNLY